MFSEFIGVVCGKVSLLKVTKTSFKKEKKYRLIKALTVHLQRLSRYSYQGEGFRLYHNFASVTVTVTSVWLSLGPNGDGFVLFPDVSYTSFRAATREQNDPLAPSHRWYLYLGAVWLFYDPQLALVMA